MSNWLRAMLATAVVALATVGCANASRGPLAAADQFVSAFARHDMPAAAAMTSQPEQAARGLAAAWDNLHAQQLTTRTGSVAVSGDSASVDYTYRWQLTGNRSWTYSGHLPLLRHQGRWQVRWAAADIHPQLGETQTLAVRLLPAPRARVNEHTGTDVLVPALVREISFDPRLLPDPHAAATSLAAALHPVDDQITAKDVEGGGRATVAELTDPEFDRVSPVLLGLPGVLVERRWDMVPTDRRFAAALITQLRKSVVDGVDGTSGWSVVTVNTNGIDTDVLTETAPQPAPSVSLTLDRTVQNAAQTAVDKRREAAMTVVLQPSTGAILAVAQNQAADAQGLIATTGLYPPGSTFKTVTAAAAMASGLAEPETVVPCPSSIVVGERTIPNDGQFGLGDVSMAAAYGRSCNTSFAKLASELAPDALTVAAARLGIGPDYSVAGLPTVSGSVPVTSDPTTGIEDGIGQGKVLVSPFGMALLAATVARGSTPLPYVIEGVPTTVGIARVAPAPTVVSGLRQLMRQVVTDGTAARVADQGEVYGKTGEAESADGSHAWFVGYRGDLAFATLLVNGGSSDNAVAVTREMLAKLRS